MASLVKLRAALAALVLLCAGSVAQAESLRCNGATASEGDSKLSVLYKCGQPVLADSYCAPVVYAGTWHLVWKTQNAGGTWAPSHNGMIDDSDVMTLTVDSRNPQIVYATACTGIYKSVEAGSQWIKLRGIPYSSRRTRAFAVGHDRKLLLAGTTEGLWVSENGGGNWLQTTPKELIVNAVI